MPRSMTGFGVGRGSEGERTFTAELRSVNHRYCEVRSHLPSELAWLSTDIEAWVREGVRRGRIDVSLSIGVVEGATLAPRIDLARARGLEAAYRSLAEALGLEGGVTLEQIAAAPGVIRSDLGLDEAEARRAVKAAVDAGLAELVQMRDREGAALDAALRAHLGIVRGLVARVREAVPRANEERRRRLTERLHALATEHELDPSRLAQEAAMLVDRADVTEEVERLDSHFEQFERMLGTDEPIGRKLDFLVQEMNRETNTIGSKASDAELAHVVVDLKSELERIREQIQNLE